MYDRVAITTHERREGGYLAGNPASVGSFRTVSPEALRPHLSMGLPLVRIVFCCAESASVLRHKSTKGSPELLFHIGLERGREATLAARRLHKPPYVSLKADTNAIGSKDVFDNSMKS